MQVEYTNEDVMRYLSDEITRLNVENARLKAALDALVRAFSDQPDEVGGGVPDSE